MDTGSARRQPPIDTTIVTDTCITCGALIKAMAKFWERLKEIHESRRYADLGHGPAISGDPTWAELYEQQVCELAEEIHELRIAGDT